MKPENFRLIARAMRPAASLATAEVDLVHEMRAHHQCAGTESCECRILIASGAFFSTVSLYALENVSAEVYERLLTNWVDIALAYDRKEPIGELVFKMYSTACTYRVLVC